jgi:hypothetical protein
MVSTVGFYFQPLETLSRVIALMYVTPASLTL